MSTSPKKTDNEGLQALSTSDDPMSEQRSAYARALEGLPGRLRSPLSTYVKEHVAAELAPEPVTRASFWAHILLCFANVAVMTGLTELDRITFVNAFDFWDSLGKGAGAFIVIWSVSAILAAVLRMQTRKWRLSPVFVACTCAAVAADCASRLSPFIQFYVSPPWLALFLVESLAVAVLLFWLHWFLKHALHTSRKRIIKLISLSVGLTLTAGSFAKNYKHWDTEETIPEVRIVPFAANSGRTSDFDTVITANLDRAESSAAGFAGDHKSRGWAFLEKRNYSKALASYEAAIKADPKDGNAYSMRGQVYVELEKYDAALKDFDTADALGANDSMCNYVRAAIYFEKNQPEKALAASENEIKKNPKGSGSYYAQGVVAFYSGNYDAAIGYWNKALELEPKDLTRALWIDIASRRAGKVSPLAKLSVTTKSKKWPRPIVDFYLGKISREDLAENTPNNNSGVDAHEECEAGFFSAQRELEAGHKAEAKKLFQSALPHCLQRGFMAHAVKKELGILGKTN